MAKLFPSLAFAAAVSTMAFAASADPDSSASPFIGFPRRCAPGAQVACSCGDGSPGTATCNPNGVSLSVCACAKVTVNIPTPIVPVVLVPDIRVQRVRVRRRPSPPMPGLALLIGGACTLGTGAFNVAFGVDRIRHYGADPFGIVSVSLGGTAMLVGLPITIVGIVRYATEPKEKDADEDTKSSKSTGFQFAPTTDGFAIHF